MIEETPFIKKTPLMLQYEKIKVNHPDKLLFFRMGDFYELFNEDAEIASKVLGITLTARGKSEDAAPLAGIPYHALDQYLPKVIKAGYKAAICEQMEDPALAKGIVKRAVTRIITPGTLIEENLLNSKANNYIVGVYQHEKIIGVCAADISTGEFFFDEMELKDALNFIARLWPAECILSEEERLKGELTVSVQGASSGVINYHSGWTFDGDSAKKILCEQFSVSTLEGFGIREISPGVIAAGGLLDYLKETQREAIKQITRIRRLHQNKYLLIDKTTQKNLELVRPMHADGIALIDVIDDTKTNMGGRLIRRWLLEPLMDISVIEKRQDAVGELMSKSSSLFALQSELKKILDIERILSRICARRVMPREIIALKNSLLILPIAKSILASYDSALIKDSLKYFDQFGDLVNTISNMLKNDSPANLADGGFINDNINPELDELRNISTNGKDYIASLQVKHAEELGIPKLKVGYNRVFGYYFEVSHLHSDKIPNTFIRKQTLANAERFISPELKEYETKVLGAQEKILKIENELYQTLLDQIISQVMKIQLLADDISEIDVLSSFASIAIQKNFNRPELNSSLDLIIKDGRHPVIEHLLDVGVFVPNDLLMQYAEDQIMLITGPNMAGKSTYIRQIAILVIMAQMGCYVPARSASIGLVDKIFTRVGASDDLSKGHSTFMVEMTETANILNNARNRSLVILDEVGRGTSTFDGVSLAWSITEFLHNTPEVAARTIFATHYHELLEMEALFPRVTNYNVSVKEWKGDIIFQHKIVKGGSDKSYGIHVAKLAGLPSSVLKRAKEILSKLEKLNFDIQSSDMPKVKKLLPGFQLTMFSEAEDKIVKAISEINVNEMTPLDALIKLKELQKLAKDMDN
jgi:DNA mismatch repair protein MutS